MERELLPNERQFSMKLEALAFYHEKKDSYSAVVQFWSADGYYFVAWLD